MSTPPSYISGVRSGGFTYTSGQYVDVVSGGVAYNMTIDKGAYEFLDAGGSATNTIVNKGGEVDVEAKGAYASGTILSGGLQSVTSGVASSTHVYSGGVEDVSSAGTDYSSFMASGGGEHVYSGGIAYKGTIATGGVEFITQGGSASSATVDAGGRMIVAGDVLYDTNFSATSGTAKAVGVYKGGVETITFTGIAKSPYNEIVNTATSSGYVRNYYESGTLEFHIVRIGNEIYDTISGMTYSSTSPRYANAGSATGVTVEKGGVVVLGGGSIGGLSVAAGGEEIIGGTSVVHSAGAAYTFNFSGVTVSDTAIGKGATQIVNSGNIALSATISAGGKQIVENGATATDSVIDGGQLILSDTGNLAGSVSFKGSGGGLVISSTIMPTVTISGFGKGDHIQLAGVTSATGAKAAVKTAGIITITDGGTSYNLHIAGATVGQKVYFNSASILTTAVPAPAQMQFLAPPEPASEPAALAAIPAQSAAAATQTGWVREIPLQGATHPLLTSAAPAATPVPLSGGTSY